MSAAFTISDLRHLQAAEGWLELGSHLEANEELEGISPTVRGHPNVLEIRWQVFAKDRKWEDCVEIASTIVKLAPERSSGWIQRSFSLHELGRTKEAFDNLLPAIEMFPRVWSIPYNLSCYCAQLGDIEEATGWFKKAMSIDKRSVQNAGIDDPDLKPLWDSMSGSVWKRLD